MQHSPLSLLRRPRTAARLTRAVLVASATVVALGACGDSSGPVAKVADISFASASEMINVGQTIRISPTLSYTEGKQQKVSITWRSSNASVASVDTLGKVTGVTPGSADISATAGGRSATVRVTVLPTNIPALVSAPSLPSSLGDGNYTIRLAYVGTQDARAAAVAQAAIDKWRSVITGDLSDVAIDMSADDCYEGQTAGSEQIDDMLIYVRVVDIDGSGKVLARAGPCYIRQSNGIPVVGVIEFDLADLDRPVEVIGAVFTHEIGHVLGIGPRWGSRGLLFGGSGDDPMFVGAEANAAYQALGASATARVPVENSGGSGTRNTHWRETTFRNELMTGFVSAGANPMSTITVASLRDLGYRVDMNRADSYALSSSVVAGATGGESDTGTSSARLKIGEELLAPRFIVNDLGDGRKRRIATTER